MKAGDPNPLRALRETAVSLEDALVAEVRGRHVSAKLAETIREVPARRRAARRRQVVVWGGATVSMLGLALALILAGDLRRTPPALPTTIADVAGEVDIVNAQGKTTAATRASCLETTDEIVTRTKGRGSIVLPGGARADLSEDTRVRLQAVPGPDPANGTRLALFQGKVKLHVPHLGRGQSFAVVTPQAEVVVHGTTFSVEVVNTPGEPAETCVAVDEGLVGVSSLGSEALLSPGMHWSSRANGSQCSTVRALSGVSSVGARSSEPEPLDETKGAPPSSSVPGSRRKISVQGALGSAPPPAHAGRGVKKAVDQKEAALAASSAPVNPLAAQNRLFEAGMVARQKGDEEEAIRLFEELLRRYPDSALASEANEQRRRAHEHLQKGQPGSDP